MKKNNTMHLCLAPMDGITTCATRLLTKEIFEKCGAPHNTLTLRTEFMNVDGFLINPDNVIKHLQTTPEQQPIAQIYGGNETTLLKAAISIEREYGHLFSGIELNLGCPSTTVMKCGGGSDMMKNREKTLTIIQHLSEQLEQLPFSIKVRTGLNEADKPQQADFLVKASQRCSTISIHGRTLKQLYSGDADWEFIAQVQQRIKAVSPHCQIIGNGGITSYEQAKTLQKHYELNGIMIGQAAIGNPRIFTPYQPTLSDKLETILRHLDISVACDQLFEALFLNGRREICLKTAQLEEQIQSNLKKADFEAHSTVEFRKFLFQYLKGIPGSREWKSGMLSIKKYRELRNQIIDFFENKG